MSGRLKGCFQWDICQYSCLTCYYYRTDCFYISNHLSGVRLRSSAFSVNCCFLSSKYWFSGNFADRPSVCYCIPLIASLSQLLPLLVASVICDSTVSYVSRNSLFRHHGYSLDEILKQSPHVPWDYSYRLQNISGEYWEMQWKGYFSHKQWCSHCLIPLELE